MSMNVKVGQVWTYMLHTQWEVVGLRDDGKWGCKCVHGNGSPIWRVGDVASFLLATKGWTLVRDVEPQVWRRVSPAPSAPATRSPEPAKVAMCIDCDTGPAILRHHRKLQSPRPICDDCWRGRETFHYEGTIQWDTDHPRQSRVAALASLGSEGFTARVPSRSWER
jgi:hypothetical protein